MPKFKNKKRPNWNMKRGIFLLIGVLFVITFLPLIHAAQFNYVVSNSEKWTDVYSSIMYANLQGIPNSFLTSTADGNILMGELDKTDNVQVLTSTDQPYIFSYPNELQAAGFAGAQEIKSSNFNTELINDLPNITNFIVVGDSFGYNALAVAPYAIQKKAWVFLADANNIYEIDSILSKRNINSLLIYGYVDPNVRSVLSKYNPTIIDNGDRFTDNIQIVQKYLQIDPTQQVVLTNGAFIEQEIMAGTEPVLFTGQTNVPTQISNWLKNSSIKVGVLIGNDLVNAATNIRQTTGISVMVKFARNARDQTGGVAPVQGLDLFPVPTPTMEIELHSVQYNKANSALYVTYKSNSNIPVYFKGTITLNNGGQISRTGDLNPIFFAPGGYKTVEYSMNLTPSNNMTANVYTIYGETSTGLEEVLDNTTGVSIIEVIDSCALTQNDIKSVDYNKQEHTISININNPNNVACWASAEIEGMKIGYSTETIGTDGAIMIPADSSGSLQINQPLSDTDIQSNPYVNLVVNSGEREDSLVNTLRGSFKLNVQEFTLVTYLIAAVILILIGLIIAFLVIRRKKKDYY